MTANNNTINKSNANKNNINKSATNKNTANKKVSYKEASDKRILCSFAVMSIVPLLVQLVTKDNGLSTYDWYSSNSNEIDFFLIYKMFATITVMIIMLMIMGADWYRNNGISLKKIKDNKFIMCCCGGYILLAFISALLANNTHYSLGGGYAQYESFFVLLAYVIILIFTYGYINNISTLLLLYRCFAAGVFVMALIGVLQFFGADFFESMMGRSLITMFSDVKPEQVSLKFGEGRVYLTLYNPNYVGSYVGLVLPIIIAGIHLLEHKWEKIASIVTSVMLIICLIGSWSTTGMSAIILSAVLVFVINIKNFKKKKKEFAAILTIFAVAVIVVTAVNMDKMKEAFAKYQPKEDNFAIKSAVLEEDDVCIDFKGNNLYIQCDMSSGSAQMTFYDSEKKDNEVAAVYNDTIGGIEFSDAKYSGLVIKAAALNDNTKGFSVIYEDKTLTFTNDNDKHQYLFCNVFGKKVDNINNADRMLFNNHEQFASGRGFIWSRSIPLLFKNAFIGCGPDNFVYEFPNDDYISLINNGYYAEVVTRPHNMYLQIGVQTGMMSLVLFILAYVVYFVKSIRLYMNNELMEKTDSRLKYAGMAILTGTFAYMVCGFANDSTICVAPVFWAMTGVGLACNHMIVNNKSKIKG